SQDASANIQTAFARLVTSTYHRLAMLRGTQYQESDIWTYLNAAPNELFDQSAYENIEAQNELINEIQRAFQQEHRVTFYKMKEKFTHKPYGWSLAAIQCLLAMLHNRGRLEMRSDSNTLEGRACLEALKNTRGFPNVLLVPQIDFTARQIHDLRDFYNEFFDTPPAASDGSALGKETKAAFQTLADKLRNLLQQQEHYPFLQALNEPLRKLDELARQSFAFFLTDLHQQADDLLDTKESVIAPIRRFMAGKQISTYTECKTFLMREEANFTGLPGDKVNALRALLDDPQCYSGNKMITARQQMESIRSEIQNQLAAERQRAQAEINKRRQSLQATDEYQHLNPDQQQQIDTEVERFVTGLDTLTVIASVRDSRRRFTEQVYPDLLTRITNMAHPRSLAESPETAETPQPPSAATISLHTIRPAASQHLLADEAGVDAYLAQLKQALMEEIGKGNRISL
ncbi:MAG: hypothetical protein K8R77_07285, partial [Anaerolineaceae bacterium]|nr:hypothetical protein [Anaerolineaceae bacterium]